MLCAALLAAALLLRCDTFGDPNLHGDETFYFTVGNAMHALAGHPAALPYVDVWDRKPFGLFALYYLLAGLSPAPLAYQLAASLFAAGTAMLIARIAMGWCRAAGGLLAGLVYLLWLPVLQGYGGQSPVFYNLFIAGAVLLALRARAALHQGLLPAGVLAAMLLAGLAITIKTTALFEALFVGLLCLDTYARSPVTKRRKLAMTLLWALIGALPTLAIVGTYAILGHFAEFWHAMVGANLAKAPGWQTSLRNLAALAMGLTPIALLAGCGLAITPRAPRGLLLGWLAAAVLGLVAVPNFYPHYALPLLVPLCIAAGAVLGRGLVGLGAAGVIAFLSFSISPPGQFAHTRASQAAMARLAAAVRTHSHAGGMLLYDAPPYLHVMTGEPFLTPLVFPTHLSQLSEKDVSHLSTLAETKRVLAHHPGAVVMAVPLRNAPVNEETHRLVLAYVGSHCRLITTVPTLERDRTDRIAVWGDCDTTDGKAR